MISFALAPWERSVRFLIPLHGRTQASNCIPYTQDGISVTASVVQRLLFLRFAIEIQLIPSLLAMKTVSTYLMIRFGQPHRIISMNLIKQVFHLQWIFRA